MVLGGFRSFHVLVTTKIKHNSDSDLPNMACKSHHLFG